VVAASGARRRLTAIAGVVTAIAIAAAAVAWLRSRSSTEQRAVSSPAPVTRPTPVPLLKRVAVGAFENRTGDGSLDSLGKQIEDRTAEVLAQIGRVEVVSGPESAEAVVQGAYAKQGGTIELRAELRSVAGKKLMATAGPVELPTGRAREVIERLAQDTAGRVASYADPFLAPIGHAIHLPNLAAYREYVQAIELRHRGETARSLQHFEKGAELDPGFILAPLRVSYDYFNRSQYEEAASVCEKLIKLQSGFTPVERALTEEMESRLRGDRRSAYEAIRRAAELAPGFNQLPLRAGILQVQRNLPREALTWFAQTDPEAPEVPAMWWAYWAGRTEALHMVGEHARELEEAQQGRRQSPASLILLSFEVRALAALGRTGEVEAVLREASSLTSDWDAGLTAGDRKRLAADELLAHGHIQASGAALEQAEEWFRSRPPPEATLEIVRSGLWNVLYRRGKLNEARALGEALRREFPKSVEYLGRCGALAARQARPDEAQKISNQLRDLDRKYLFGEHTLWRSRIAALLGDREIALKLLREAFAQGAAFGVWLHRDVDFESLQGDPGFRELLQPRG
ncbi:MAG TPA: hypothetical protein VFM88_16885, partial [Vicinamibacteria bacterium]|nr:hypothetical protein [Vicinamibacteria bacterium]